MIASIIVHDSIIRFIVGFLIAITGVAYGVLEFIPSISPPENFRTEGNMLADDDEEDVI